MRKTATWVAARLATEPVYIGGAVLATVDATFPHLSTAWKLAVTWWVTVVQRMFVSPTAEIPAIQLASYREALADVSSLAHPALNDTP